MLHDAVMVMINMLIQILSNIAMIDSYLNERKKRRRGEQM